MHYSWIWKIRLLVTVICYKEVPFKAGLTVLPFFYFVEPISHKLMGIFFNVNNFEMDAFLWNLWLGFMMLNATFNNISVILWRSVLLVEEIGLSEEKRRPVTSHWQTLSHYVVSKIKLLWSRCQNNKKGTTFYMPNQVLIYCDEFK